MARRDDLKRLITIQSRRLQKLKEKKAQKGVNADADLLIEIEDTEAELEVWQAELEQIEAEPEPEGPVVDRRAGRPELDSYLARAVAAFQERMTQRVVRTHTIPAEPYKFLYAFEIEDANIFFGRDAAGEALYRTLLRDRLTVLHAKSGAGKTSLLNAGLSPRLIGEGRLPVQARAYDDPVLAIKRAILPSSQAAWPAPLANLNLYDFLSSICPYLNRPAQELVIILDQFEEFFIFWPERDHRRPFIDALADCYDDRSLPVRFIIALRKDYYSDLADFQRRLPNIFNNEVRLEAMTRTEAQTAITGPVAKIGRRVTYEPELLELLLDDLTRGGVELPHLQIICTKLYEALAPPETTITLTAYERLGQAQGILSSYLNQVLDRFPHEEGNLAREILKALVSSEATKRVLSDTTLAAKVQVTLEVLHPLLSRLVNARLLCRLEIGGETSYEIAHEVLIEEIGVWIDVADLAFKQAEELLAREVKSWQVHGILIPPDRLELLYGYREKFRDLDAAACECLMTSALWADFEIEVWAGILGHKAEKSLVEGVNDARDHVRRAALRSLGLIWSFSEVSNLGSEDENVRITAARRIGELADPRGVAPLMGAFRNEGKDVYWAAAKALGQLGDPRVAESFIGALEDENSNVRLAAAKALGQLGDPRGVEPLIATLRDKDKNVHWAAAGSLVKLGAPAVESLIGALGDKDRNVRRTAAAALEQLSDPRGVEPLIATLSDNDRNVYFAVVAALVKLGTPAVESLIGALEDENSNVRLAAALALGRMSDLQGEPLIAALEVLIAGLKDREWKIRQQATNVLTMIGKTAIEPLIAALQDDDSEVRQRAALVLEQIGDERAVEPLIIALDDKDKYVAKASASALKRIGTPEALAALKQRMIG